MIYVLRKLINIFIKRKIRHIHRCWICSLQSTEKGQLFYCGQTQKDKIRWGVGFYKPTHTVIHKQQGLSRAWRISSMRSDWRNWGCSVQGRIGWGETLLLSSNTWKVIAVWAGLVSSHRWQVTGQGEMASCCTRVSLGWISGKTSLRKGLLSTRIGSPGRWLSHHPWMCLKTVWMWCSGTWWRFVRVRVVWLGGGWTWWSLRFFPTGAILWFLFNPVLDLEESETLLTCLLI